MLLERDHRLHVELGTYEWVHLGHVAAQPEQPAARGRQKQAQLNERFVRTSGNKLRCDPAHEDPDQREHSHRQPTSSHCSL